MRLIIGGAYQGKKEYAKRRYQLKESQIWQGGYPVPDGEWNCIYGLHNIVKQMLESSINQDSQQEILVYIRDLVENRPDMVLICDEVGNGIVPVDKGERDYRECVGRVLCELAKDADVVERVHCGIGRKIKSSVYINLIRHGSTKGNLEKRYIGVTDESLCEEGREVLQQRKEKGQYPSVDAVMTSPMKRCVETAQLLYPEITPVIIEDFRETDFGPFEGRTYEELMKDQKLAPLYQAWIAGEGTWPDPMKESFDGETREQAKRRCAAAFESLFPMLWEKSCVALIVHGGTIMNIMSAFATPSRDYYDYQYENGAGCQCRLELTGDKELYRLQFVGVIGRESDMLRLL